MAMLLTMVTFLHIQFTLTSHVACVSFHSTALSRISGWNTFLGLGIGSSTNLKEYVKHKHMHDRTDTDMVSNSLVHHSCTTNTILPFWNTSCLSKIFAIVYFTLWSPNWWLNETNLTFSYKFIPYNFTIFHLPIFTYMMMMMMMMELGRLMEMCNNIKHQHNCLITSDTL